MNEVKFKVAQVGGKDLNVCPIACESFAEAQATEERLTRQHGFLPNGLPRFAVQVKEGAETWKFYFPVAPWADKTVVKRFEALLERENSKS